MNNENENKNLDRIEKTQERIERNQQRIHQLEIKVAVLEKDSLIHTKALEKMEIVMDRSEAHIEALNRNMLLYEERGRTQIKTNETAAETIKELDEKIEDFQLKQFEYLATIKSEIVDQIKELKETIPGSIESEDKKKFKIFRFLVDNWKYIAFAVAIFVALMFNKWGLLTSLLGITGSS